mmetsp:Transcript_10521/g.36347  ORF Transcript_10521/g.36347 Transcript_10521/m.36347 type:complete len:200 (+) Transcript_10521:196-795(+)
MILAAAPDGGTRAPNLETPPLPARAALPKVPACIWTFTVSSGWMVLWLAARASAPAMVSFRGLALEDGSSVPAPSTAGSETASAFLATNLFLGAALPRPRRARRLGSAFLAFPPLDWTSKPPRRLSTSPALRLALGAAPGATAHARWSLETLTHLKLTVASVMVTIGSSFLFPTPRSQWMAWTPAKGPGIPLSKMLASS